MRKKTQKVCLGQGEDNFYTTKKSCNAAVSKKRVLKIMGASGFALIMGIGTLCGVLLLPIIAAQANANISTGEETLTSQEKLLFGQGLGLDPENDPVVYTTDYGLEIKYANTELTNTNLAGYTYFTMGEYNGTPVNWVIIGYDPSMRNYVGDFSGLTKPLGNPIQGDNHFASTLDNSPAGIAIKKDCLIVSSLAVANEEIGDGCVLCLSEFAFGSTAYGTNSYEGSTLQTCMQNLYNSTLSLTDIEKSYIIPQNLNSVISPTSTVYSQNQYMFAPGYYKKGSLTGETCETFALVNYLPSEKINLNVNNSWVNFWTRARSPWNGYSSYMVYWSSANSVGDRTVYTSSSTLRPMFVFRI